MCYILRYWDPKNFERDISWELTFPCSRILQDSHPPSHQGIGETERRATQKYQLGSYKNSGALRKRKNDVTVQKTGIIFFFPLLRNLYHLFREMGCKLVVSMPSFIITNFPLSITHTFFYLSLSLGQHEVSLIRTVSNKEAFPHFLPFPLLLSFIFLPCSILGMGTWCICAYWLFLVLLTCY